MSADLHIHVLEGATEDDVAVFCSHTLGSRFFDLRRTRPDIWYEVISATPNIWIGQVSWLKAAICEEPEAFVPSAVAEINVLIGEYFPVLTPVLREGILAAFALPNTTGYRLAEKDVVAKFLDEHMGKQLFTVSW